MAVRHYSSVALCVLLAAASVIDNGPGVADAFLLSGRKGNSRDQKPPSQPDKENGKNTEEESTSKITTPSSQPISPHTNEVPSSSSELPPGMTRRFQRASPENKAAGGVGSAQSGSGHGGSQNYVLKCKFVMGGMQQDGELPTFYIPAVDKKIYEQGLKDIVNSMAGGEQKGGSKPPLTDLERASEKAAGETPSLNIECDDVKADKFQAVDCKLCIYNEVSKDKKHVRQGQVLDTKLKQCMDGKFLGGGKLSESSYHPICYPPDAARLSGSKAAQGGRSVFASRPAVNRMDDNEALERSLALSALNLSNADLQTLGNGSMDIFGLGEDELVDGEDGVALMYDGGDGEGVFVGEEPYTGNGFAMMVPDQQRQLAEELIGEQRLGELGTSNDQAAWEAFPEMVGAGDQFPDAMIFDHSSRGIDSDIQAFENNDMGGGNAGWGYLAGHNYFGNGQGPEGVDVWDLEEMLEGDEAEDDQQVLLNSLDDGERYAHPYDGVQEDAESEPAVFVLGENGGFQEPMVLYGGL